MSSSKIILENLSRVENALKEIVSSNFLFPSFDVFEQFDLVDKYLDFLVDNAGDEQKNKILKMLLRRNLHKTARKKVLDEYSRDIFKVDTTDIFEWFINLLRSVQQNEKKESTTHAD